MNITLPEETLALLDRVAKGRSRSRLIDLAVRHFVESLGRKNLRERLEEGYRRRAKLSRSIAAEWFPLEEEAWERYGG